MKKDQQVRQLSHLIIEFYPGAKVFEVDVKNEVIHFYIEGEEDIPMKAIVERCANEVIFKYHAENEWCYHKHASFARINEINEEAFFKKLNS